MGRGGIMKVPHFVWFGLAVIIACSASASLAANGDNLVANGTFDTDTSSWTGPDNSPAEWTADDADGAPDSGSVAVGTQTSPSNNGSPVRSTCIPVVGGRDYVFAASRKWVARSSFGSVDTFVTLFWYEACGGAKLTDERIVGATDHWTATQLFVTAPPHAGYAKVYLAVSRDIDNLRSGGTAAFDNILLAPVVCGDSCGEPVSLTCPQ
jgi:hypothetical protein